MHRARTIMNIGRTFDAKDSDIELAVVAGNSMVVDFEKRVRGSNGQLSEGRRVPTILPAGWIGDPSAFNLRRLYFCAR